MKNETRDWRGWRKWKFANYIKIELKFRCKGIKGSSFFYVLYEIDDWMYVLIANLWFTVSLNNYAYIYITVPSQTGAQNSLKIYWINAKSQNKIIRNRSFMFWTINFTIFSLFFLNIRRKNVLMSKNVMVWFC